MQISNKQFVRNDSVKHVYLVFIHHYGLSDLISFSSVLAPMVA